MHEIRLTKVLVNNIKIRMFLFNVCVSIETNALDRQEFSEIRALLNQTIKHSSQARWEMSLKTNNIVRFYYWEETLADIFASTQSITEKNAAAHAYLNTVAYTKTGQPTRWTNKDLIWQEAMLSFSHVIGMPDLMRFLSLLNPPLYEQKFGTSKNVLALFRAASFNQDIPADQRIECFKYYFNIAFLYLVDLYNSKHISAAIKADLQGCLQLITIYQQLPIEGVIVALALPMRSVFRALWLAGAFGAEEKYQEIALPNRCAKELSALQEILMVLNLFSYIDSPKQQKKYLISTKTTHQQLLESFRLQTTIPLEKKIKIPALLGYNLRYLYGKQKVFNQEPIWGIQPLLTFYFTEQSAAQGFYQQFKEKFAVKKVLYIRAGCEVREPVQQKNGLWQVTCMELRLHIENKLNVYRNWSHERICADLREKADYFKKHWRNCLKRWSSYFEMPGVSILLADREKYLVTPLEHEVQVRVDARESSDNVTILCIRVSDSAWQHDLLHMQYANNYDLTVNLEVWQRNSIAPRKLGEVQLSCQYKNASYIDNPVLTTEQAAKLNLEPEIILNWSDLRIYNRQPALTAFEHNFEIANGFPEINTYDNKGKWTQQGSTRIFSAPGFPWDPVAFPTTRRYADYKQLLEPQTPATLADKRRIYGNLYIEEYLKKIPEPKVVEVGPGAGHVATETKALVPACIYIGITVTPIDEKNRPSFDEVYYAPVPSNCALLEKHMGTVDLGIDVFAGLTYSKAIDVLIYMIFLLKPGGKFFAIVSGLPYHFDSSPLGNGEERSRIINWLKETLGITLEIHKTQVASKVNPGTIVEDFVLEFTMPKQLKLDYTIENFLKCCRDAQAELGVPYQVKVVGDTFGKFGPSTKLTNIMTVRYDRQRQGMQSQAVSAPTDSLRGHDFLGLAAAAVAAAERRQESEVSLHANKSTVADFASLFVG
ncbi:MAG TPA: hypothetical protein VHZ76_03675 [Gammaproteobacteria bacterium]|jgi:hypothetical protein|nr:hypothetical protein [Gammaproteobacteria bacterium]